jgi:tetratricopeptide (TPR) repeat protein
MRKAESLDPLSLIISADMADVLFVVGLYDESIRQSRKTLEMDPNFAIAHFELGQAYAQKRMYSEAIAELQRAIALSGSSRTLKSNLAYTLHLCRIRPAERSTEDTE